MNCFGDFTKFAANSCQEIKNRSFTAGLGMMLFLMAVRYCSIKFSTVSEITTFAGPLAASFMLKYFN